MFSLPPLVLPRLLAPWSVGAWDAPAWRWLHFGSSSGSKGCNALGIVETRLSIIINPFVVILINNSINSVLVRPEFLFSSDSSISPSSPPCRWFPRLLAGSSESFLSRAMTGFLWQVVFWLKTAVIQCALPPAGRPGKRPGGVRVRERERESLGGSTPQSLLVSRSWGVRLGLPASRPHPHPAWLAGGGGFAQARLCAEFTRNVSFWKVCGAERHGTTTPVSLVYPCGSCAEEGPMVFSPQESEDLERQNAALRREIKQLTEEMKHFASMLSSHEPLCSILTSPPPPPEVLYATHSFHQPHISSPRFQH